MSMNENMRSTGSGSRIDRAEDLVSENIARFETAMERLTDKVEETSKKIQHVMDLGLRQKEEFTHLKEKAESAVMPLVNRGRDMSRQLSHRVKEDPKPLFWAAAAIAGGAILLTFLNKRRHSEFSDLNRYSA